MVNIDTHASIVKIAEILDQNIFGQCQVSDDDDRSAPQITTEEPFRCHVIQMGYR